MITGSLLHQDQLPQQIYQVPVHVWGVLSSLYHNSSWCLIVCLQGGKVGAPAILLSGRRPASCYWHWSENCNTVLSWVRGLYLLGSLYLLLLWHHQHQHYLSTWCRSETREGLAIKLNTGISWEVDFEMGLSLSKGENKNLTNSQHRRMELTTSFNLCH